MSGPWRVREAGLRYAVVFIVDASVAVAAAVEDAWSEAARDLFRRAGDDELSLLVPELFWYEVANVLRYRFADDRAAMQESIRLMAAAPVATLPLDYEELADVAAMALDEGLTVHDAAYLYLAKQTGCNLITQDERLLAAEGGRHARSLREIGF